MQTTVICVDVDGNEYETPIAELEWRPSAYGIIIKDNELLLAKQYGKYDLPGGGVDLGERLEDGVLREIKEETGLIADNPRSIAVASNFFRTLHSRRSYHSILVYFVCDLIGGELSTDGFVGSEIEYGELAEWVPIDKLDDIDLGSTIDFRPFVKQALQTMGELS